MKAFSCFLTKHIHVGRKGYARIWNYFLEGGLWIGSWQFNLFPRASQKKQELLLEAASNEGSRQRVEEMEKMLDEMETAVTEYDERLVRKLIEKITVYDGHFTVEFISGLEMEVAM